MTKTVTTWFIFGAVTVAVLQGTMSAAGSASQVSGRQTVPKAVVQELRRVGITLADAVIRQNIDTILKYDRPDLREADWDHLQDSRSELHCFIFNTECNSNRRKSVRDVIAGAKHLQVQVQVLAMPGNAPYGLLLFFDARNVNLVRLSSAQYLCSLSQQERIASWLFKFDGGLWTSAHPPFDFETDTLCPPR